MSWFPMARGRLFILLYNVTEPVFLPIRRLVQRSPLGGPGSFIDFAPLFAFLFMFMLRDIIIFILLRL